MRLILVGTNKKLCEAWQHYFKEFSEVEIVHDSFENLPEYDCMVSAANSFGIMDGGIDLAITKYFGEQLMQRVMDRIRQEYRGEQPVGTSFVIETRMEKHPYLAHTPTMRYPMSQFRTDVPYTAMWAMLNAVANFNLAHNNPIQVLACPGLATGVGGVPELEAARQMALAYRYFITPLPKVDWDYALERQEAIRFGGYYGYSLVMEGEKS